MPRLIPSMDRFPARDLTPWRPRPTAARPAVVAGALGLALALALDAGPGVVPSAMAGPTGQPGVGAGAARSGSLAQAELMRRQALVSEAAEMVAEARLAMEAADWERARSLYEGAWRALPDAPATADWKRHALEGFADASVRHATQLAAGAELDRARAALDEVLADGVHPEHAPARTLRRQLDDPERHNPAMTPEHLDNVGEVQRLLRMAQGYYDLADWGQAEDTLLRVLRIDPYNVTARRQMESVQRELRRYLDGARDHTRERMLTEVDSLWETEVPVATDVDISGMFGAPGEAAMRPGVGLSTKLQRIIIPRVELTDVTVQEAVDYLSAQASALDTAEPDPDRRGVSFVVSPSVTTERVVNLDLRQVPLEEALRYVTTQSDSIFRVEQFAVRITTPGEGGDTLVTRTFQVPPNFIQRQPMEDDPAAIDPFAPVDQGAEGLTRRRIGAREFLEQQGVTFPEGANATFNPANSTLVVRNTQANLEMVEFLVEDALGAAPRQVEIRMTMLQIRSDTLNELGFDWLMGPFDLGSGNFASGGTAGNVDAGALLDSFPVGEPGALPIGQNPVTAGLRSTGALTPGQTIQSLLGQNPGGDPRLQAGLIRQGIAARSPTTLTLTGALTSPQYQAVLRALNQSRDADIAVAPAVVTRSGQRAQVEVAREFPYPIEFDPPEIPQQIGGVIGGIGDIFDDFNLAPADLNTIPFAPGGPSAFDVRRLGVILDVEPVISEDNTTIDLNISPEIVQFEGFIDYGSPVTIASGGIGNQRVLAPQPYVQPVFRTNRLNTAVTVYDGATVVIGGAITQDIRGIHDKVPIFGDVPLAGRLFQSKLDQNITLNVVFFVHVRVIDPGGRPVNR